VSGFGADYGFDFLSKALSANSLGEFLDDITRSGVDISDLTVADLRRLFDHVHKSGELKSASTAGADLSWEAYWAARMSDSDPPAGN
jgi:hypothetical protein